jgi:hypothetical protein
MRLNRLRNTVVAVGAVALTIGCVSVVAPVSNLENQPVSVNKPSVTLDEVGNAIVRAGASLSMTMRKVRPGLITATYTPRELSATMEIRYDSKQYSITYKDSQGLKYDGSQIHKTYNNWVRSLDDRIRVQLSTL